MRRSFITVAGVLVFMAGFLAAISMPSSGSAQSPPSILGVSPNSSPVWNVQPGQVRVYVWVWWYDTASRRLPGKPVKIFDWRGQKLVGWQSAHSEHWRELRLRPNTRVCVKAFVKNAKTTPSCQVVARTGQKLVFVVRLVGRGQPTPTGPKPPTTLPTVPPPTTPPARCSTTRTIFGSWSDWARFGSKEFRIRVVREVDAVDGTTVCSAREEREERDVPAPPPTTTTVVTVTTTTPTTTTSPPSTRNLVVRVNGYGRVTSASSGMDCQGTVHSGSTGSFTVCSTPIGSGSTVTLTATPSDGNWRVKSGCSSSNTLGASTSCQVVMDTEKTVDVIFEFIPPPPPPN